MSATLTKLDDLVTIDTAAKTVHMNRERLRKLVKDTGIAIVWGGTEKRPILKVRLADLQRVIMQKRFVESRRRLERQSRTARLSGKPLHPDVRC